MQKSTVSTAFRAMQIPQCSCDGFPIFKGVKTVFATHGEPPLIYEHADTLREKFHVNVVVPRDGDEVEI